MVPIVPSLSSTKDATLIKVTTTGDHEQQTASSEDKLRGMVAEMNQTLKELSGSAIDANVDPNTNQVGSVTIDIAFSSQCGSTFFVIETCITF